MIARLTVAVIGVFLLLFIYLRQAAVIRREEYGIKELVDSCEVLEAENRMLAVRIEQLRSFSRLERTAAERGFESPVRRRAPRAHVPRVGVGKLP